MLAGGRGGHARISTRCDTVNEFQWVVMRRVSDCAPTSSAYELFECSMMNWQCGMWSADSPRGTWNTNQISNGMVRGGARGKEECEQSRGTMGKAHVFAARTTASPKLMAT